jgi:hypothetical protein
MGKNKIEISEESLDEIVKLILYGKIDKAPWNFLGPLCPNNGSEGLSEESIVGVSIAATLKQVFMKARERSEKKVSEDYLKKLGGGLS